MSRLALRDNWIDTTSWLTFLRGDRDTVERYLFSPGLERADNEEYQRCFTSFVALQHLTVHFWNAISTSFMFFYSLDYLALCLQAVRDFANGKRRYSDVPFRMLSREFAAHTAGLHFSTAGGHVPAPITTLQVIEGCAALCSYRLCYPHPSHADFLPHIQRAYPAEHLFLYARAYQYATSLLNDGAFDLFAPACYLALHADDPGQALPAILLHAKEAISTTPRGSVIDDPITFLLNATGTQEDQCFPMAVKRNLSHNVPCPPHPILQPYVERLAQACDHLRVVDFFARPYFYRHYSPGSQMQKVLQAFLADMPPPAIVYSQDVERGFNWCHKHGLARCLGDDYLRRIADLTIIVGLSERLVFGNGDPLLCPHQECPFHKTGLCQNFFAFPLDNYEKCPFPDFLDSLDLQPLRQSVRF